MTADTPVLFTREGAVASLRFNRPLVLNAISQEMADALRVACQAIADDRSVRAVLLSGEGNGFMAGGDISAFHAAGERAPEVAAGIVAGVHASVGILTSLPVPVIAAVHGAVAGAGLSMMLAADLILAAEGSHFRLAYPRIGANPDGGATWALPRVLGLRRALSFALLGEEMDARTALKFGLVTKVVPAVLLMEQAREMAHSLAMGPTLAFGRTKALLRAAFDHDLDAHLRAEGRAFVAGAATADFHEGITAFLEKRLPRFSGA